MKLKLDYDLHTYVERIKDNSSFFHTFINKQSLAVGVLVLEPGNVDTQEPHDGDEVYFVLSGDGYLKINNKNYQVSKDKLFFVAKDTKHCFYGNTRELKVLYFFGCHDSK